MTATDIQLVWCSESVPKGLSELDQMLEASGIWELVDYAAFTGRPTTIIKGIKDSHGTVVGELVISFDQCGKKFIESEMKTYITAHILQLLPRSTHLPALFRNGTRSRLQSSRARQRFGRARQMRIR